MIKLKNSIHNLFENAKKMIYQLEVKEAIKIHSDKINLFIDKKDIKIKKPKSILGFNHLTSWVLKFWPYTNSKYHKELYNENFNFIFYYPPYWSSALTKLTANNIQLLNTSYMIGGYDKWHDLKTPIEETK